MPLCVFSLSGRGGTGLYEDRDETVAADGTVTYTKRTDYANCEYVIQSGSEYSNWDQLTHMTIEEANVIGASVAVVWAIAWGFRAIRRAVADTFSDGDN